MRIIISILGILLLFQGNIQAQTFHLILVSATSDRTIGEGCQANVVRMTEHFKPVALGLDMRFKVHPLTGSQVKGDSIDYLINRLQINRSDIVVFHYSGHGTNNGSNNEWPRFLITDPNRKAQLSKIHQKLLTKKPRLLLSFSDSCNGRTVNQGRRPNHASRDNNRPLTSKELANYNLLFKEQKGDIIIAASKRGTVSYYDAYSGGFFTLGFCEALRMEVNSNARKPISWESVLLQTQQNTREIATGWNKQQSPIFKINLTDDNTTLPVFGEVSSIEYTVKRGDTLSRIAANYQVSVANLKRWNNKNNDLIVTGEQLVIHL